VTPRLPSGKPSTHYHYGTQWTDTAENDRHTGWARDLWDALKPYSSGGQVLTLTSDLGEEATRAGLAATTHGWSS